MVQIEKLSFRIGTEYGDESWVAVMDGPQTLIYIWQHQLDESIIYFYPTAYLIGFREESEVEDD